MLCRLGAAGQVRLEDLAAELLLPGHGDPWTGGVQAAIRQGAAPRA